MKSFSTALPATPSFSALLDIRGLLPGSVLCKLSENLGPSDQVSVYGTLDSTATSASANLTLLGSVYGNQGDSGNPLTIGLWPFLFAKRTTGTSTGTFFVSGPASPGAATAPGSTALPSLNAFSAAINLANFGSGLSVRIGLDKSQTASDVFNVYGTNDSAFAGTAGGELINQISGGGSNNSGSVLVQNFQYVYAQRIGGATAGNLLAWGADDADGGGVASFWDVGGNATGPLTGGTLDGSAVTVGGLSAASPTSVVSGTTGDVVVNSGTTGSVNLGTGDGGVDTNAKTVYVATGAGPKTLVMGSANTTSSAELLGGSGGIGIGVAPPGASGATIDTPGAGVLLIGHVNANYVNIGPGAQGSVIALESNGNAVIQAAVGALIDGAGGVGIGENSGVVVVGGVNTAVVLASGIVAPAPVAGTIILQAETEVLFVSEGAIVSDAVSGNNSVTAGNQVVVNGGALVALQTNSVTQLITAAASITVGSATAGQSAVIQAGTGAAGGIIISGGVKSSFVAADAVSIGTSTVIGTAAATVDAFDIMEVIATAGALTLTLPSPADTTRAHRFTVINAGATNSYTMYGKVLTTSATPATAAGDFFWSPTRAAWVTA